MCYGEELNARPHLFLTLFFFSLGDTQLKEGMLYTVGGGSINVTTNILVETTFVCPCKNTIIFTRNNILYLILSLYNSRPYSLLSLAFYNRIFF
jgi:hypothetical protein